MNAIRKILTRKGNSLNLNIKLPDNFTAKKVELIILPFEDVDIVKSDKDRMVFSLELNRIFSRFNADITGFKFNRDELYDRP